MTRPRETCHEWPEQMASLIGSRKDGDRAGEALGRQGVTQRCQQDRCGEGIGDAEQDTTQQKDWQVGSQGADECGETEAAETGQDGRAPRGEVGNRAGEELAQAERREVRRDDGGESRAIDAEDALQEWEENRETRTGVGSDERSQMKRGESPLVEHAVGICCPIGPHPTLPKVTV